MGNDNYTASIQVEQSPEEVYKAVNNVRGWWSEEIEGPTDELNKEWFYHYKDMHLCKMKVVEMVPNKKVVWEVLENHFSFIEEQEWEGNHIVIDITREQNLTQLNFTHEGLNPACACFDVCRDGWNNYIHKSLYQLITT
ncbi:MAG: ATPase, partial [Bacteroidetes bacterium RIFCSPHIGHO2_02_FULL_44_7]